MFETFAKDHLSRPWEWGLINCALPLADWVVWNGHPDPAAELRGAVSDAETCAAFVEGQGGLLAIVERCCASIGLREVAEPEYGAIAVIGSPTVPSRQWGAIFDGLNWRVRMEGGYPAVTARPLRIWAVR